MAKTKVTTVRNPSKPTSPLLQGMMKKAEVAPVTGERRKRNEGYAVPVTHVVVPSGQPLQMAVNISEAPVPHRRYAAELCSLDYENFEMRVVFAQRGVFADDIDSALVIRMSKDAVVHFANNLLEMPASLDEVQAQLGISDEPLSLIASRPSQTANVVANMVLTAVSGREACIDFYHASAFAFRDAENREVLEVEPVVRVDLRSSLYLTFARKVIEIAGQVQDSSGE